MKIFLYASLFFCHQLYAQPVITSISPLSGPVGTSVTISGTGFSNTINDNIVFFGAVKASILFASTTALTVSVPTGASYQPISVTMGGLTGYSAKRFVVTFPGSMSLSATSFSRVDQVPVNQPAYLLMKDLDDDGKPDLIYSSAGIVISRNNSSPGNLSFGSHVIFPGPNSFSNYIATEDLNGDGKPDIVAPNYSSGFLVFKNTSSVGTISMDAGLPFSTGDSYGIAITDIDGDGKPDLAITNNELSGKLKIHINTSSAATISFSAAVEYIQGTYPRSVSFGYLNNDNKPDLIIANQYNSSVSVYVNTSTPGNVSFAPKIDLATPVNSYPESIAVGDFDLDGKDDLAVTGNNLSSMGTVSVFRNTSTGATAEFASAIQLTTGVDWNPYHVEANDMDGDGKPEIVVTNQFNSAISIFRNNSSVGMLSFASKIDLTETDHPARGVLYLGDLDGDEKPDLVAGSYDNPMVISIFYNTMQALPVHFLSFSATLISEDVLLKWEVDNESAEVDRYEIERSSNGFFNKISTIEKKANNLSSNSYSFSDEDFTSFQNARFVYYRIKQVDIDGRSIYSQTRSIRTENDDFAVAVFPNPGKTVVSAMIDLPAPQKVLFRLLNATGIEIKTITIPGIKGRNIKEISLTELAPGAYFLKIQAGNTTKVLSLMKGN